MQRPCDATDAHPVKWGTLGPPALSCCAWPTTHPPCPRHGLVSFIELTGSAGHYEVLATEQGVAAYFVGQSLDIEVASKDGVTRSVWKRSRLPSFAFGARWPTGVKNHHFVSHSPDFSEEFG